MYKIKLAIIEDNRDLCQILCSYINDNFSDEFDIIGVAHNGGEGIKLLTEIRPDMALIDIVLPVLDGISILERLNDLHLIDKICCMMLTAVSQDDITAKALSLGARYYFLKPFDNEALVRRLIDINQSNVKKLSTDYAGNITEAKLHRRASDNTPESYATSVLQKIGIPVNLTGYYYLRKAIVCCIEDKSLLSGLTKELYPSIGKEFKTTGQRVERSIRHSIEKAWEYNCSDRYYTFLGRPIPENHAKPSNGVFIMDLVDYYKINYELKNL